MPIILPKDLPAVRILQEEQIFVMSPERAQIQAIRPLKLLLLNLMPTKITTETQFARLLSNTPLQVDLTLLTMASYESKNTSKAHLEDFYTTFEAIQDQRFDGLIITGAPVEHLAFEAVDYWEELEQILEWSKSHVYATMHICWGAQAGLNYHYGIDKVAYEEKLTGVFRQSILAKRPIDLLRGLDDSFTLPHSRYTGIDEEQLRKVADLEILVAGPDTGASIVQRQDGRQTFMLGHAEYDRYTLAEEYQRDLEKSDQAPLPLNYFKNDDPTQTIVAQWRSSAHLIFANWINHVYQETPYDLDQLESL